MLFSGSADEAKLVCSREAAAAAASLTDEAESGRRDSCLTFSC